MNIFANAMSKKTNNKIEEDSVLREIWRVKDALSAARGHSVEQLFAVLREREKLSGHPLVSPPAKPRKRSR